MNKEEKLKKLKKVIKDYNKEADKKGIRSKAGFVTDMPGFGDIELVKTGIYKLDKLIGGIPKGRYSHIYGPESSGKSTLVEYIMGSFQKQDLTVALANNERNYENSWAIKQGLDVSELVGGNFSSLEECLNFAVDMAETDGACDLLTIDTITAISSLQELMKKKSTSIRDMNDDTIALIPRKLSQFFRMATAKVDDSKMALLLVNQVRTNIDSYGGGMSHGGGNALNHNKSLDLRVTRSFCKKVGFENYFMMNIMVMKSKFPEAREKTSCSCYFKLGKGIDNTTDILLDAIDEGLIEKATGWYTYENIKEQGYLKFSERMEKEDAISEVKNKLLGDINGNKKSEEQLSEKI